MDAATISMVKLIKENISEIDPRADVILYGSRARGDAGNNSDWDILVLTDYPVNTEVETRFRDNLYLLELETGEALSLFLYSKQEWNTRQRITPYFENVSKQGILL
jgi:predicted nucleotidyltransferase